MTSFRRRRSFFLAVVSFLASLETRSPLGAVEVRSVERFLADSAFDAWNPRTEDVLVMKRDASGILQLHLVKESSRDPEREMRCLSCNPLRAVGIDRKWISKVHKGASDWHPSGEWFVTEVEIPGNPSWKFERALPAVRLLAEPGAGWWNNLFLVKRDGSLWVRLTDFTPRDAESGVLYPKISADGRRIAWAERIGGAKPFSRYPFARWVLRVARLDLDSAPPRLTDVRTLSGRDGGIFEPQQWSKDGRLLFAADIGLSTLPYPGYRIDVWEARVDANGDLHDLRNLTGTKDFYEEQASYSPDEELIAFMANHFDLGYEKRIEKARQQFGDEAKGFIVRNLLTELYVMDREGKVLGRLTRLVEETPRGEHSLVTRSAWSRDGTRLLAGVTRRSNLTGQKVGESVYRIELAR